MAVGCEMRYLMVLEQCMCIVANILVKFVAEEGAGSVLRGAVAVGNPWDLVTSQRSLSPCALASISVRFSIAISFFLYLYRNLHLFAIYSSLSTVCVDLVLIYLCLRLAPTHKHNDRKIHIRQVCSCMSACVYM